MFTNVLLTYKRYITTSRFKEYIDSVVVVSCCLFAKSYLTLSDPKDYSPLDSSVHGISQARILKWVAISFFRGSYQPRDQAQVSCIGRWVLYH